MLIIDSKVLFRKLEDERKKLKQSLQLYNLAIVNNLDNEIDSAHKRMLSRQRVFQRIYNQLYERY